MIVFRKASRFRFAPRTLIFGLKSSLVFLQKSKSKEKYLFFFFRKASLVMVLQLFKVKLTDGFAGI
jgi:hypothetical protein